MKGMRVKKKISPFSLNDCFSNVGHAPQISSLFWSSTASPLMFLYGLDVPVCLSTSPYVFCSMTRIADYACHSAYCVCVSARGISDGTVNQTTNELWSQHILPWIFESLWFIGCSNVAYMRSGSIRDAFASMLGLLIIPQILFPYHRHLIFRSSKHINFTNGAESDKVDVQLGDALSEEPSLYFLKASTLFSMSPRFILI